MAWWGTDDPFTPHLGLEELEVMGGHGYTIGVPVWAPAQFKRTVVAAVKAYAQGYSSIDYVLDRYGHLWEFEHDDSPTRPLYDAVRCVREQVVDALDYFMKIPEKPDRPSLFACTAALFRLQNSFRATAITIRSNLHFESAGLARMILEQLAWVFVIGQRQCSDFDHFKIRPSGCIGGLKEFLPAAGRLYGELSRVSHLEPEETTRYISVIDGDIELSLGDAMWSRQDALVLLMLADYYSLVGECVYAPMLGELRYLRSVDGDWVPDEARPYLSTLTEQREILLQGSNA